MKILSFYIKSYSGLPKEIWYLSFVMFINRGGAMVIPFLSLYITKIMGYSMADTGIILGFYGIGSLAGTWAGGQLTDRFGWYWVQVISLVSTGFAFFLLMTFSSFIGLCTGLFLTSALADSFRPASMASVAEFSPPELRTRSIGLIRLAINLGFSAGPAIGGTIAMLLGYKMLFIIDGVTCILAAILFTILIKKVHDQPKPKPINVDGKKIRLSPLKDGPYMFLIILVGLQALLFMQYFHTMPVFFANEFNFNEGYIGMLMATNGFLIALTEVPLLHFLEKRYNIFHLIILGSLLIGLCYLVLLMGSAVAIAWISILLFSYGEIFNLPFTNTLALNRSPDSARGRYMAMYSMAWSACNIIAPFFGLRIADYFGFDALWVIIGILTVVILVSYLWLKPRFEAGMPAEDPALVSE